MSVYDLSFMRNFGYPEEWLKEAETYGPDDSYVLSDTRWQDELKPPIPPISIYEMWRRTVNRCSDDTAVIFLDKKISYKDMDLMINKYAALLLDLGIKKGDVVATMLPNSLQQWIAFFGANRIGAIHTPVNVMYREREIEYQIKDSGAKAVMTFDLFYQLYYANLREKLTSVDHYIVTNMKDFAAPDFNPEVLGALKAFWDAPKTKIESTIDLFESIEKYQPTDIEVEIDAKEDLALLLYTAGTTAPEPKGVMETHFNLVYNSMMTPLHPERTKTVDYSIMPMFHTAGYMLLGLPTFYEGGVVIPVPIFDAEWTLKIMQDYKVTVILGPPTLFIALMDHPKFKSYDLSSLDRVIACGAPVPPPVQEKWNRLSPCPTALGAGWGMTETNSPGSGCSWKHFLSDSIGVPVAAEMKICDDESNVLPRGQTGEIYFRGPQVCKGYWNKPEETKETFLPDGWMKTGDLGYIDEESFVHFVDRKKDLIIASGYNVAPVEVENVIYQHPAVLETAVIGTTDPYRGETVKAFVSLRDEYKGKVTEQEIIDFCKDKLATFKRPRVVEFLDEIPKNVVGKSLRRVLREQEAQKK